MIVVAAVGIRGGVTPLVGDVLQRTVTPAMVIAGGAAQVVGAPTAAVAGQHIVEIEDEHIGVGVVVQPLLNQPAIERGGVGAPCAVLQRRRGDDDEELVLARGEIGQDVVVDALGVGDGYGLRTLVWPLQGVVTVAGRIVRVTHQVGVWKTRLEHHDLISSARIALQASVAGVLLTLSAYSASR